MSDLMLSYDRASLGYIIMFVGQWKTPHRYHKQMNQENEDKKNANYDCLSFLEKVDRCCESRFKITLRLKIGANYRCLALGTSINFSPVYRLRKKASSSTVLAGNSDERYGFITHIMSLLCQEITLRVSGRTV